MTSSTARTTDVLRKNTSPTSTSWPLQELSTKSVLMILAWPFIAKALVEGVKKTAKHLPETRELFIYVSNSLYNNLPKIRKI